MGEKKSYFNVDRILEDSEWAELKAWMGENKDLKWKKGDIHPDTGLSFFRYKREFPNGEYWVSEQDLEDFRKKERKYKEDNIENIRGYAREAARERQKLFPEKVRETRRSYWHSRSPEKKEKDRIERQKYIKRRIDQDPVFKTASNIRGLIKQSFRSKNFVKGTKTEEILGISFPEFQKHLESIFEPWMNWGNRGGSPPKGINEKWEVDHVIPISSAKTVDDVIRLNHYSNLQPLCSYTNRHIKGDKLDWQPNG